MMPNRVVSSLKHDPYPVSSGAMSPDDGRIRGILDGVLGVAEVDEALATYCRVQPSEEELYKDFRSSWNIGDLPPLDEDSELAWAMAIDAFSNLRMRHQIRTLEQVLLMLTSLCIYRVLRRNRGTNP